MCVTVCAVQKTHTCPVSNSTTPTETSQLGCRRRSRVWSSDFGGGSSDSRPNHAAALPALRSTRASPSPVWPLQHFIFKHMHGDFHPTGSPPPPTAPSSVPLRLLLGSFAVNPTPQVHVPSAHAASVPHPHPPLHTSVYTLRGSKQTSAPVF